MTEPTREPSAALGRDVRLLSLQRAVALAQAQSGTFELEGNEEIPQAVFDWLYAEKYLGTTETPAGDSCVIVTPRGERLLRALLRGHDVR